MNHDIIRIAVSSRNPVKIQAARQAFEAVFPKHHLEVKGFSVPSGVADQPATDAETFQGALNRIEAVRQLAPEADFRVGIEGGIDRHGKQVEAFAWMVIADQNGQIGKARSASFMLPEAVVQLMDDGLELGHANDRVFGEQHSKHKGGAVGLLTGNLIDRTALYTHALILACIPFKQVHLFSLK